MSLKGFSSFLYLLGFFFSFPPFSFYNTSLLALSFSLTDFSPFSFGRTLLFIVVPMICFGAQSVSVLLQRHICLKARISAYCIPNVNDLNSISVRTGSQIFSLPFSFIMRAEIQVPNSQRCTLLSQRTRYLKLDAQLPTPVCALRPTFGHYLTLETVPIGHELMGTNFATFPVGNIPATCVTDGGTAGHV